MLRSALRSWFPVLAAATLVSAGPPGFPPDRPAEVVWNPAPKTPLSTAGSGEGPQIRLRLQVDPRGKVAAVEVLGIKPPGRYDDVFREEALRTVSRWRFAPAVQDGRPVESIVQWTLDFIPLTGDAPSAPTAAPALFPDADQEDFRRQVLALPEEQRQHLLDQLVAAAEAQLDRSRRREASAAGFTLVTDVTRPGAADQFLTNLQAIYHFTYDVFRSAIPEQPAKGRLRVYVFASDKEYRRLVIQVSGLYWSSGFYHPAGLLAFSTEQPSPGRLLALMIHETTHALLDRHIVRPGVSLPRWLDEGFAEYMGASDVEGGKIVVGAHRKNYELQFEPARRRVVVVQSAAKSDADAAKEAVRKRQAFTLADLIRADPGDFYGDRRRLHYSQAFLAVHFLRHAQPTWASREFPSLVLYIAEGYPPEEAFRRVYGQSPETFQGQFERYIRKF